MRNVVILALLAALPLAAASADDAASCQMLSVAATKVKAPKPGKGAPQSDCAGSAVHHFESWVDADLDFERVGTFVVPDVVPVTEGSAGNQWLDLEVGVQQCGGAGFTGVVTCRYKWTKAKTSFAFVSCDNGARPGDQLTGNALSLHVAQGGNPCPAMRTTALAAIKACGTGPLLSKEPR